MENQLKKIWDGYPYAVTVCDSEGIIIYMNDKAAGTFEQWGGKELLGQSLMDCHSPKSREIIKELIEKGSSNTYTIEKNGVKKLIHQAAWFENNKVGGLVEISIILPETMAHHKRS